MNFGPTLKMLRKQRKFRQKDLADYLHVSRPTIAGYETKNKQPDFEKLEQLANLFEVPIDYLVTGINRVFPTIQDTKDEKYNLQLTRLVNYYDSLTDQSRQDLIAYTELLLLRDRSQKKNMLQMDELEDEFENEL